MKKYEPGFKYGYISENNFGNNCRICGYKMDELTWIADERYGSNDICPCCGCEFGLNDTSPNFVRENRKDWGVGQDMDWFSPKEKPENWSWDEQRKQIPPAFREIDDGGWEE